VRLPHATAFIVLTVDAAYVNERVAPLAQKGDLSRFIL
jgi:ATP-dependent protease HslVU (ClpYQ) ATPase subunit